MGIEADFSIDSVRGRFDAFLEVVEDEQIKALQYLGEMCVAHARSIPKEQGFQDRTGNLRGSIGYVVFVDGVAIHSLYKDGASIGAKKGEALAKSVGAQKEGICLVVTAGMNYALYVESRGRDVVTSAELLAKQELPRMLEQLKNDINEAMR
jgi:hypothetical protein